MASVDSNLECSETQMTDSCHADPPPQKHALIDVDDPKAGVASVVASHYNDVPESGIATRTQSRIFYMRNFNNWIKSVLIGEFIQLVRRERPRQIKVLDLCCGKGGDLLKWKKSNIDYLVCADIAATSVEQCESRYKENVERSRHERHGPRIYQAEFLVADCTRARLRDMYRDRDIQLDIVSCQFSFHYCFESHQQARRMLQNAAESLRPGGYFIATTLDANELVKRWRAQSGNSFGNDVYQVTFFGDVKDDVPLFGAKYNFSLEGSVMDCPEFLVHFPLLIKMAAEHGLELVLKKSFSDYFTENIQRSDHRSLLNRMQAMETYPADADKDLVGTDSDDYAHAKLRLEEAEKPETTDERQKSQKVGTLTKSEWEAITLYIVCAFRKVGDSATDHAATDHAATDHAATDHAATDHAATDYAATDHAATDHAATDHAATDQVATDHAAKRKVDDDDEHLDVNKKPRPV